MLPELGIGLDPFSPISKSFMTGTITSTNSFADDDLRNRLPRFTEDARRANQDLAEITAATDQIDLTGDRYPAAMQKWINR